MGASEISDQGPALPAVFLDRDGVIIRNREDYLRSWNHVEFLPGAMESLRRLATSSFRIFIITNQSVVGRGLIALSEAQAINDRLLDSIAKVGGRVDHLYMCPHAPSDQCPCRKPNPGLIEQACASYEIDLTTSILIGDSFSDLLAGQAAGIPHLALVRTGLGNRQLEGIPEVQRPSNYLVFSDLSAAIDHYAIEARPS